MNTNLSYPYTLPPLPYDYDALEPYIDADIMHYHHDKHFQTYINNLNDALESYPQLQSMSLSQLLSNPAAIPPAIRDKVMNNGGGVYNHDLFFRGLAPASEPVHIPEGKLADNISQTFGSFESFKKTFSQQALSVFGSGWTALCFDKNCCLKIINLKNQETSLMYGMETIMLLDVWEHAYYLQYKNDRKNYVENSWNVLILNRQ